MKKFSDLDIQIEERSFTGPKMDMFDVLNQEIEVHDYKIVDSKFKDKYDKCLHMQIQIGNKKHVLFSSSKNLMYQIERIKDEDFPIKTIIVRQPDKKHVFT